MNMSRKLFTVEYVKGQGRTRVRIADGSVKYNPQEHFMAFEESDYLERSLNGVPYATFTTDERDEMENLIHNGYRDKDNRLWTAFFAYWKDQQGHAFMVPADSGIRDLRDVGVITEMETQGDFMKVAKYANRLFAALPKSEPKIDGDKVIINGLAVWGKEVSWSPADQTALIELEDPDGIMSEDDRELAVRYVDLKSLKPEEKALVDGCIIVSEKAVRSLGLSKEPRLGMAWRGTFGTERGLGKGHILYKNDMSVDVVIYGPKTILKTNKFFFGSMGELHVGMPHTDRQAFVNFHFHRDGLAVDLARTYMREVFKRSEDEHSLRMLFLAHTKDMTHAEMDNEAWILRRALQFGVSPLRFPGLFRRVRKYLMEKVMACDDRARIPMESISYSIAKYAYVLPDPNAIDAEGNVVLDNAIPDGHIVFPDIDKGTKVVCYRQPSEHSNAWVALKVLYRPEYQRFAGRGICLLGKGAHKVLGRLGGGDMDDSFVIVHDPKWVEAFHTMRPYPETEKVSDEDEVVMTQADMDMAQFTDELMEDIRDKNFSHYTNKHVSWQMEMAKNARAGIGPVVNYGMIDMLLSDPDHYQSVMEDLGKSNNDMALDAISWMETRELYEARKLMSNLETVIDGNVKDSTLLRKLGDVSGAIKKFHKACKVYPSCMSNRVPESKEKEKDYMFARSLMCKALDTIKDYRDRLETLFLEREWAIVAPADNDLRADYPFEPEIAIIVRGKWRRDEHGDMERVDEDTLCIMDIWAMEWRAELARPGDHDGAYQRICRLIQDELIEYDDDMMERIAVELYYRTYRSSYVTPEIDEVTGRFRAFRDGLLWSPVFGNHFINALRKSRLAGYYKMAQLRPEFLSRLIGKSVAIEVRSHAVYVQDSEDKFTIMVGLVWGKAPDGKYRMDGGLIEFRKPQPICLPEDELIVAQKPLTRLFPPVTSVETPTEQPKKGVFGNILEKALDILGK